mmetsp:Transcript_8110/g.23328  ORF Transcript_8110/g.23328 Transcript_8110/m.23328 type:complete len:671 (-) Transcript_8110:40-2052(-)|eukprot:CAMPEP_0119562006 /NCGR_PEP_ID=MMETSP1352-20130426/19260_1 /TAXON_ID=265584 /ORGANISM="Stauroneis constricta, Strain CCMP1120" /LENGTH=670 /DNA_ID=CAMNT_0007610339 /DNA_START=125 /DNA_END=2137 /DNA_ORIENTATION=+
MHRRAVAHPTTTTTSTSACHPDGNKVFAGYNANHSGGGTNDAKQAASCSAATIESGEAVVVDHGNGFNKCANGFGAGSSSNKTPSAAYNRTRQHRRRRKGGLSWRALWNRILSCPQSSPSSGGLAPPQQQKRNLYGATTKYQQQQDDMTEFVMFMVQVILVCLIVMGLTVVMFLVWHRWDILFPKSLEGDVVYPWWNPYGLGYQPFQYQRRGSNGAIQFDLSPMPPSKIYTIPTSMEHIGDKSDRYARLRKDIDDKMTSYQAGDGQHSWEPPHLDYLHFEQHPMETHSTFSHDEGAAVGDVLRPQEPYDIYNCPDTPPAGYPFEWNLMQLLTDWPPDDAQPRSHIHQGLCVFDYQTEYAKAMAYREAEVPFVTRNDPKVMETVHRWNTPGYMHEMLGAVKHRAEYSLSNHFLYWNAPGAGLKKKKRNKDKDKNKASKQHGFGGGYGRKKVPENWTSPTEMIRMTYGEWLNKANATTENGNEDDDALGPNQPHWYFRLIGCGETGPHGECDAGSSEYLFDELTFFQPKDDDLYLTVPEKQRGIHCRFGMKGVIAENHFDGSRNSIAVLGGARRYILNHPNQCENLHLYPKGHPSARHSEIDWSRPDEIDLDEKYTDFARARGNEVVLQAGDVLYLPTQWFHYIISLTLNYQCNTRSGIANDYTDIIHECGF